MHIEPVDERESSWHSPWPRFRVYRYRLDHPAASWTTITDDVTGADVGEVIAWAREQAGTEQLFAVALVVDDHAQPEGQQRGLVWLLGDDVPNACEPTEREQRALEVMFRRREEYRATAGHDAGSAP